MENKTLPLTKTEKAERRALVVAWLWWNGKTGTKKQIDNVTLSLDMLRRMCALRGINPPSAWTGSNDG